MVQSEQYPESFANTEVDQFSKVNPVDENQKAEKLTDSPELRINPVGDASSELITKPTHDTNNDSESNIIWMKLLKLLIMKNISRFKVNHPLNPLPIQK